VVHTAAKKRLLCQIHDVLRMFFRHHILVLEVEKGRNSRRLFEFHIFPALLLPAKRPTNALLMVEFHDFAQNTQFSQARSRNPCTQTVIPFGSEEFNTIKK